MRFIIAFFLLGLFTLTPTLAQAEPPWRVAYQGASNIIRVELPYKYSQGEPRDSVRRDRSGEGVKFITHWQSGIAALDIYEHLRGSCNAKESAELFLEGERKSVDKNGLKIATLLKNASAADATFHLQYQYPQGQLDLVFRYVCRQTVHSLVEILGEVDRKVGDQRDSSASLTEVLGIVNSVKVEPNKTR